MRKLALALLVCALPAASASAQTHHHHHRTVCQRIASMQAKAAHRRGHRSIGRDICTRGVYVRHRSVGHRVRQPSRHELWNYYRQLRTLARPAPPFLSAHAGHPRYGAAGVYTLHYRPRGYLARCIVSHESGGNPRADNGTHKGLAQWSQEAWFRMGGGRYASSPLGASVDEQLLILSYGLVHYGCRDWCPYDRC